MTDITYTPAVSFPWWRDGEDVVTAEKPGGFNERFDSVKTEYDKIATAFGQVNTAIKNIQQLQFLQSQPVISIAANAPSTEFEVETYDRTLLPPNVDKAYFCVIFPVTGINIMHTFLYHQIPGNKVHVTIAFYNPTGATISFSYRILALAEQ
jgi:hypothetical protein